MENKFSNIDLMLLNGTSFHFGYVNDSAENIDRVLGNHELCMDEKVFYEWPRKLNDNIVFSVYDYKYYKRPPYNEKIIYHIGTKTPEDTEKVVEALKLAGLNSYIKHIYE